MGHSLLTKLRTFLSDSAPINKNDGLLIAVSGGMDSMCLLYAIKDIHPGHIEVAHMNYHLRGADSEKDEQIVKETCRELNIICHTCDEPLEEHSFSIQEIAREKRYSWLEYLRKKNALQYILTAHHMDDQFETILHHLVRGSGIRGLSGMDYKSKHILRPLLDIPKSEIKAFQSSRNIPFREDATNKSSKYTRNYLRNEVLPLLDSYFKDFESGFETSIQNLKSEYHLLKYLLRDYIKHHLYVEDGFIHFPLTKPDHTNLQQSLFIHLLDHRINSDEIRQLTESKQAGTILHKKGFSILRDRDELIIRPYTFRDFNLEIKKTGLYAINSDYLSIEEVDEAHISKNPYSAYISPPEGLFPLAVRSWRKGDCFPPLGMNGKMKKLSDLFIDAKLHQFKKQEVPVLTHKDEIIWVLGMRLSDNYKVNKESKEIYKLSYSRRAKDSVPDFFNHLL